MYSVGDSNNENNFHFTNIKLSKTQMHLIGQSGGFLDKLLGPSLKKNVLKPLPKSVLIPQDQQQQDQQQMSLFTRDQTWEY